MSSPVTLDPSIIVAGVGIIATLIGIVYRSLRGDVQENDDELSAHEKRLESLECKVHTVFAWAFGNKSDPTDRGLAQDVDTSFEDIRQQLDRIEDKEDARHEELMGKFRHLVDVLHDEDALEFERDDVE